MKDKDKNMQEEESKEEDQNITKGEIKPNSAGSIDARDYIIPQDFDEQTVIKKVNLSVKVGRSNNQQWIFIPRDEEFRKPVAVIEDITEQIIYLVSPKLLGELQGYWKKKLLVTYFLRNGAPCLWPIALPDENGYLNSWPLSAHQIIAKYPDQWVKVVSERASNCYVVLISETQPEPPIIDLSFEEILNRGFLNSTIETLEHPFVKRIFSA